MDIRCLRASWFGGFRRFLYPVVLAAGLFVALPSDAGILQCYEGSRDCEGSCSTWGVWNGRWTVMSGHCCWIDTERSLVPTCWRFSNRVCYHRCMW